MVLQPPYLYKVEWNAATLADSYNHLTPGEESNEGGTKKLCLKQLKASQDQVINNSVMILA